MGAAGVGSWVVLSRGWPRERQEKESGWVGARACKGGEGGGGGGGDLENLKPRRVAIVWSSRTVCP